MNQLLDYVKQLRGDLDRALAEISDKKTHNIPIIRPIRLDEIIGPETDVSFKDRDGTLLYFSNTDEEFNATDITLSNIASLDRRPMDIGERVPCIYHKGVNYPLYSRTVRHAITCKDDSGVYPASNTNPDVFPIKFVKLTYTRTAGAQGHTLTYLQPIAGPDNLVHNIFDGPSAYIPEGSLIQVYAVIGLDNLEQWFTFQCCQEEESGSGYGSDPPGSTVVNNIISSYSSLSTWKKTNIDNSLADDYGLTVCYGPFDLTTFSDDSTVGTRAWTDPDNAESSDGDRADAGPIAAEAKTHYLKALEVVGYSPDANFVPKAVHVTIERRDAGGSGRITDSEVKLVVGGAVQAVNEASDLAWPASDATMNYRFATTASRAQTLANDFGVVVAAVSSDAVTGTEEAAVDLMARTGWTSVLVYQSGTGATHSVGGPGAGGPGSGFEITILLNNNFAAAGECIMTARYEETWTPDGQLISGSVDYFIYNVVGTLPNTITLYLTAEQSGVTYIYTIAIESPFTVPTATTTATFSGVWGTDFSNPNGSGHPDFSAGAANIKFGIGMRHNVGSGFSAEVRLDEMYVNAVSLGSSNGRPQIDHVQMRICGVIE